MKKSLPNMFLFIQEHVCYLQTRKTTKNIFLKLFSREPHKKSQELFS